MDSRFADWYEEAHPDAPHELLTARWKVIAGLTRRRDIANEALDLTRLLYRPEIHDGTFAATFRELVRKSYPTLPMRDAGFELQVLAGAAVAHLIGTGGDRADRLALAVLCLRCQGLSSPPAINDLPAIAESHLRGAGTARRTIESPDALEPKEIEVGDLKAFSGSIAEVATNYGAVSNIKVKDATSALQKPLSNLAGGLNGFARDASSSINALWHALRVQQEESNILWWLFGEWSRDLERPISSMEYPAACLIVGKELADLVADASGPPGAVAFLTRMLRAASPEPPDSVTTGTAAAAVAEWTTSFADVPELFRDLVPVHTAVATYRELDRLEGWTQISRKRTRIDPEQALAPVQLAEQVYRERLLLKLLVG
jgi:hypothetical protein